MATAVPKKEELAHPNKWRGCRTAICESVFKSEVKFFFNMDEIIYDNGYSTDGDIGPFYNAVNNDKELGLKIEEEALPSKEEL
eukprot:283137-Ditylum_brightwellii.AAC.1